MTPEKAMTEMPHSHGKPFPWRCPECGKKEVRPVVVQHTSQIKHDGRLYTVEIPRLRVPQCIACGELVFDNEADEQIAQALREQLGLLSGDQIRKNREELGLRQRSLAEHLGVALETILRWENGALTQTRAMDRYLRVYFGVRSLVADPRGRERTTNTTKPLDLPPQVVRFRHGLHRFADPGNFAANRQITRPLDLKQARASG